MHLIQRIEETVPWRILFATSAALLASACNPVGDEHTYTLYRESATQDRHRVHMATFDADEREEYNRGNCQLAAKLFLAQPGVSVKYWCEKGRYRP